MLHLQLEASLLNSDIHSSSISFRVELGHPTHLGLINPTVVIKA